jgi:hypothetical protein
VARVPVRKLAPAVVSSAPRLVRSSSWTASTCSSCRICAPRTYWVT